ncbi:low molecular weight phosphatase family protein [Luteimicrobium sp. NPDC057192]|uniref:arsenate reductase/protein-tyrosine-phosphatase family protein n=1 Tax=Luteimicrobium sp. NPDC057192 TaxID=3346042 RepID=UPI00362A65AF
MTWGPIRQLGTGSDDGPFRVLAVCTGNVCRSPAAERLLDARLGPGAGVVVASAGTRALSGAAMTPETAELLALHGADPAGFRARQLDAGLVARADLVLALSREHRAAVVDLVPGAVGRTFTLRELARILMTLPAPRRREGGAPSAARLRGLRDDARLHRGAPADPDEDDVADPYGRGASAYRRTFDEILPAVDVLVGAMFDAVA